MFVRGVEVCVGGYIAVSPGRAFGGEESESVKLVAVAVLDVAARAEVCVRSVYAKSPIRLSRTQNPDFSLRNPPSLTSPWRCR